MVERQDASLSVAHAVRAGAAQLPGVRAPLLDARVILKHAAGYDDADMIANANLILAPGLRAAYETMIARRADGEPVAYITGEKEFWSLPFKVTPDVLIPRTDSECLIETVVARRDPAQAMTMLDLGTGSGCLLCALLTEFSNSVGIGVDRSIAAAQVARENIRSLGLLSRAAVFAGDWLFAFDGKVDLIIANPPYIRDRDRHALPRDISVFEPSSALFAGPEGLDSYEKIFSAAPAALKSDGLMVVETGDGQAQALEALARTSFPKAQIGVVNDLKGLHRAIFIDLAR